MNKKYLSFILLAVLLVGFSVVVFGDGTNSATTSRSTDLEIVDSPTASDTPTQNEDVFKDLIGDGGKLKTDSIDSLVNAFKSKGITLDQSNENGFKGKNEGKEGTITSTLDAKLEGDILTVNKLGDGGGQVKFNLSEIESHCRKEKETTEEGAVQPCVTLTKEGLVFSNNATIKNGAISISREEGMMIKSIDKKPVEIDLTKTKDFTLLEKGIKTEGPTIIKDHLDNEFDDGSMSIKMNAGGNLGVNATTPVNIFSKGAPSFLAKGEMTFNPKDGNFGATGKVTMNTEETEITFQKGTKENPVNLTSYTGKGTWINNISDLGDRYNFSTDGPIFYQGNKEGEEFFSVTTGDGRDVELSDVNPREVKIMYANVSGAGTISWSYMKDGKDPKGFKSTGEFKANQEGFFVKPKKDARTIPSLVIDKDGKVVRVEVLEEDTTTQYTREYREVIEILGSNPDAEVSLPILNIDGSISYITKGDELDNIKKEMRRDKKSIDDLQDLNKEMDENLGRFKADSGELLGILERIIEEVSTPLILGRGNLAEDGKDTKAAKTINGD